MLGGLGTDVVLGKEKQLQNRHDVGHTEQETERCLQLLPKHGSLSGETRRPSAQVMAEMFHVVGIR